MFFLNVPRESDDSTEELNKSKTAFVVQRFPDGVGN